MGGVKTSQSRVKTAYMASTLAVIAVTDEAMAAGPGERFGAGIAFAPAAMITAAALVPARDELGGANVALVLVLFVIGAAAAGGRVAGVVTALCAALSFNFFHTRPYNTLRVNDAKDMATIGLIVVVGLAVGALGVARNRQSDTRRSHLRSMHVMEQIASMVNLGRAADEVWPVAHDGLIDLLGLRDAVLEVPAGEQALPQVEHDGRVDTPQRTFVRDGFTLPASGVSLPLCADGRPIGRIVLTGDPAHGTTREQRRAAVAIADQFALALHRPHPTTETRTS